MSEDKPKRQLLTNFTTLYLAEPCSPDYKALVAKLSEDKSLKIVSTPDLGVITWGERTFFATIKNEPIPRHVYHRLANSNAFWPEALTALAPHKATLHLLRQPPPDDLLDSLAVQTLLTRVFMDHLPVLGVQFGEALTSPQTFSYLCSRQVHTQRAPIPAWIRIQISLDADKTILSTIGMGAFGLMEVECNPSPLAPQYTLDVVEYLIGYILKEGAILADGDTFEVDSATFDGVMRVHHAPSFRENVGTVYLIEFP